MYTLLNHLICLLVNGLLRFFEIVPDGASERGLPIPAYLDKLFQQVAGEEAGITGIIKCINQVKKE